MLLFNCSCWAVIIFLSGRRCTLPGYGTLSSGGESTAFDMSDGDGDETERTVLDSTDCESKVGASLRVEVFSFS